MKLTHGSLFSGIGGFDLAAEWAGFKNIFHCEWNPFGRQVLEHHFPNTDSYGDITKTDFTKYRGQITVLSGGFPCQPFSLAGKRGGADDERYLWPEMLRAIKEIQPLWVIGENVAGITSMVQPGETIRVENQASLFEADSQDITVSEHEFVIETICRDFESAGYSVQPVVIPACAVGAPHRRNRVWFIARLAKNANGFRFNCIEWKKQSHLRRFRLFSSRDIFRVYQEEGIQFAPPNSSNAGIKDLQFGRENGIYQFIPIAHSDSVQSQIWAKKRQPNSTEDSSGLDNRIERYGKNRNASIPCKVRLSNRDESREKRRDIKTFSVKSFNQPRDWQEFPTQSPLYIRNDGIPRQLAGYPFSDSKWREESVKA
ncbi:MAG: DNA (cytosine-5-)-methyltransferase, partial [Bacteroidales bacterium]